jgi:hypothetical protein
MKCEQQQVFLDSGTEVKDPSVHVFLKEGQDLLRVPSKMVVAILEAMGRVLDPEQLRFSAAE